MKRYTLALVLVGLASCGTTNSSSDSKVKGLAGDNIVLPQCYDTAGTKVVTEYYSCQYSPAGAIYRGSTPVIRIDPSRISWMAYSAGFYPFSYLHECSHFALGHVHESGNVGTGAEQKRYEFAADCRAAKELARLNFSREGMKQVALDLAKLPEDPAHPAGRDRASNALNCFDER